MITEYSEYPTYDQLFMPVLEIYGEGGAITERDAKKMIHEKYYNNYSLETLIGKSNEPLIYGRVHWALYFLFAGKYLERVEKGTYKISEKGIKFLKTGKVMTIQLLKQDEDFANSSFEKGRGDKKEKAQNKKSIENTEVTPQEMFEQAKEQIEAAQKDELLQRLREMDPFAFERVVGKLCEAMGYGTFIETPKSHDGGVDGIIKGDKLGFEKIYIQVKRYAQDNVVNAKELRGFIGALLENNVRKAIFFTTSSFAPAAINLAKKASAGTNEVVLVDGITLVDLMFDYEIGVQPKKVKIGYVDGEFFDSFS